MKIIWLPMLRISMFSLGVGGPHGGGLLELALRIGSATMPPSAQLAQRMADEQKIAKTNSVHSRDRRLSPAGKVRWRRQFAKKRRPRSKSEPPALRSRTRRAANSQASSSRPPPWGPPTPSENILIRSI